MKLEGDWLAVEHSRHFPGHLSLWRVAHAGPDAPAEWVGKQVATTAGMPAYTRFPGQDDIYFFRKGDIIAVDAPWFPPK